MGYSSWGCKELDTTERLSLFTDYIELPVSFFSAARYLLSLVGIFHFLLASIEEAVRSGLSEWCARVGEGTGLWASAANDNFGARDKLRKSPENGGLVAKSSPTLATPGTVALRLLCPRRWKRR